MKDSESIDLDYEVLLLNHLNRISELSTKIMGLVQYKEGNNPYPETHYKESDKVDAFHWAVRVLNSIIPKDLKDKTYDTDKKNLDKERKDYNKDNKKFKFSQSSYDLQWLGVLVDLLNRKGYLTESKTIGSIIRKKCEIKK